jgi:hypothetical protein
MLNINEESFRNGVLLWNDTDVERPVTRFPLDVRLTNRELFGKRFPHIWMNIWDNYGSLTYDTIKRTCINVAGFRLLNRYQKMDLFDQLKKFSNSKSNDIIDCHALIEWVKTNNPRILWHYPVDQIGNHCFKCTVECDYLQRHGKDVKSKQYLIGVEGNYNDSRLVAWTVHHEDYSNFYLNFSFDVIFHARMKTGHTHYHKYDRSEKMPIRGFPDIRLDPLEWSALNCMLNTIRHFLVGRYDQLWCLIDLPMPLKRWINTNASMIAMILEMWLACLWRDDNYEKLYTTFEASGFDESTEKNVFFSWLMLGARSFVHQIRKPYSLDLPLELPVEILDFMRADQAENGYQIRLSAGEFIFV